MDSKINLNPVILAGIFGTFLLNVGCCPESTPKTAKQTQTVHSRRVKQETDSLFSNGYAEVNGIKMYYEIHGQGKPLVLVHGGGSTIKTSFGRIIPALAEKHKIIAMELQAHGHTADRNSDLSFEQDADDVAALLKTLAIGKADFFGFSNGASTVLQVAVRHPELVNKIAVASTILKKDGTFPQFWEFMKQAQLEQMPQAYKDAFLEITHDIAKLQNMHDKCARRMAEFKDMSNEQIKSITVPVLLISGDSDVGTVEHMVQMSRLFSNCKLAIFPGGHGDYMGEITTLKPNKEIKLPVLPVLEEFLD